jgi:hypothetical protein
MRAWLHGSRSNRSQSNERYRALGSAHRFDATRVWLKLACILGRSDTLPRVDVSHSRLQARQSCQGTPKRDQISIVSYMINSASQHPQLAVDIDIGLAFFSDAQAVVRYE